MIAVMIQLKGHLRTTQGRFSEGFVGEKELEIVKAYSDKVKCSR